MKDHFKFWGAATVGSKGQIVIPAEARDKLDIKEGDKLIIMSGPGGEGMAVFKAETFEAMADHFEKQLGNFKKLTKNMKMEG